MSQFHDTCLEYQKFDVLDEVKQALFVNRTFKRNGMLDLGMEKYKTTPWEACWFGFTPSMERLEF
jgi:hypothetical protein